MEALRKYRVGWPEIQELLGISRATYYRWRKRLQEEGLAGLKPRSRRPLWGPYPK
nr:helix-turn-helix domain-containing protein [Thermus scotoductus]